MKLFDAVLSSTSIFEICEPASRVCMTYRKERHGRGEKALMSFRKMVSTGIVRPTTRTCIESKTRWFSHYRQPLSRLFLRYWIKRAVEQSPTSVMQLLHVNSDLLCLSLKLTFNVWSPSGRWLNSRGAQIVCLEPND